MSGRRFVPIIISLVTLIGIIAGAYFTFRYTLLADVRESLMSADTSDLVTYGQTLFTTRGCAGCHTLESVGATGDEVPNLTNIGRIHDANYIYESIAMPNAVIATGCPEGECQSNIMPPFGQILTDEQINALVTFLQAQGQ